MRRVAREPCAGQLTNAHPGTTGGSKLAAMGGPKPASPGTEYVPGYERGPEHFLPRNHANSAQIPGTKVSKKWRKIRPRMDLVLCRFWC